MTPKEPKFTVEIHGMPGQWTFISDHYFLGWGYKRGRFCWGHFLKREIIFIQDRNKSGLCQPCACLVREARKRRDRQRLPKASGPSNKERGEQTQQRIMTLLEAHGKASSAEMAEALGMSRDGVTYHLKRGLAPLVKRSTGLNNCAMWELVA